MGFTVRIRRLLVLTIGGGCLLVALLFPPVIVYRGEWGDVVHCVPWGQIPLLRGEADWNMLGIQLATIVMATLAALLNSQKSLKATRIIGCWISLLLMLAGSVDVRCSGDIIGDMLACLALLLLPFLALILLMVAFAVSMKERPLRKEQILEEELKRYPQRDRGRSRKISRPVRTGLFLALFLLLGAKVVPTLVGQKRDRERDQALLTAVQNSCPSVAASLLDQGANPNLRDYDRWKEPDSDFRMSTNTTLLGIAVEKGCMPMVELLVKHGADVNPKSVPEEHDDDLRPLSVAVSQGDVRIVRYLLDHGADPNARNSHRGLAIDGAAAHPEILRLLLDRGVDINSQGWEGYTPLMLAAADGNRDLVIYLIHRGANVNMMGEGDQSALSCASRSGYSEIVRLLRTESVRQHKRETK